MVAPTKFRKLAAGGVNQGDATLNRFGMVPVIQKSDGVSAVSTNPTIAVVPDDGADVLEIMLLVDDPAVPSAATVKFGTSANNDLFGQMSVSGVGRYSLPFINYAALTGNVTVPGSAFAVTAGTQITAFVSASSVGGGDLTTPPSFVAYTTFLQNKTTDF